MKYKLPLEQPRAAPANAKANAQGVAWGQGASKSAKRRAKMRNTYYAVLPQLQSQNMSFPTAYGNVGQIANSLGLTPGSGISNLLRSLGYKTWLQLIDSALTNKILTQSEVDDMFKNGQVNWTNAKAWNVLVAGAADDLPDLAPISDVLRRIGPMVLGGPQKAIPYVLDTIKGRFSDLMPKMVQKGVIHTGERTVPIASIVGRVRAEDVRSAEIVGSAYNTVDPRALQMFVCPETYRARLPRPTNDRTALSGSGMTFNLVANASGELSLVIFPLQFGFNIGFIFNDASLNLTNGTQAVAGSVIASPITTYADVIRTYRMNAASVQIQFTQSSLSAQGMLETCYFSQYAQSAWGSTSYMVPKGNMPAMPQYQSVPVRSGERIRAIKPLSDPGELDQTVESLSQTSEGFYFAFSGCSPGASLATVYVSWVYEYVPHANWQSLIPIEFPPVAPATVAAISNITQKNPSVLTASAGEAASIALRLTNATTYETALDML